MLYPHPVFRGTYSCVFLWVFIQLPGHIPSSIIGCIITLSHGRSGNPLYWSHDPCRKSLHWSHDPSGWVTWSLGPFAGQWPVRGRDLLLAGQKDREGDLLRLRGSWSLRKIHIKILVSFSDMDILQESFRLCNWLSLQHLVSWINHLPPGMFVHFLEIDF